MNLELQSRKTKSLSSIRKTASKFLPGGTSATSRINPYTQTPLFLRKANGSRVWDASDKEYIDFFMGHGAMVLGHNNKTVRNGLNVVLDHGFVAEYDQELNIELARKIVQHVPCAEKVRYQNSGSESTLLAMRLARGYTGKDIILRFDGQFHGFQDYAMHNSIAFKIDLSNPGNRLSKLNYHCSGVPEAIDSTIIVLPWNNEEILKNTITKRGHEIGGIITNPIDLNNGCVETSTEYLNLIKQLAAEHDIVVIYDEVLTGFKTGIDCGQGYMGVTPDICTLGKAISNGIPTSMVAGKADIMDIIVRPNRPVPASGTYSGNMLGTAAALTCLEIYEDAEFYPTLLSNASYFTDGIQDLIDDKGLPAKVQRVGCMFAIYWGLTEKVTSHLQVNQVNQKLAESFFCKCIENGLYFQTDFIVSAAHTKKDLDEALERIRQILKIM